MPNPTGETEEPGRGWVYKASALVVQDAVNQMMGVPVHFDIRAQRKIDNAELYFVVENTSIMGTAFDVQTQGMIRTLVLLP